MNDFLRTILLLPEQASTVARDVDTLHYFVILVTMLGWLGVSLAALVFIVKFRRRHPGQRTRNIRASRSFEFTLIGGLLTLFLVWWVLGYYRYLRLREVPDDAVEVYVTAKQWMWKFAYPDGRSSVSVLTVPAGQPVKLLLTSRDVIHSFFVPAFRIKQDVLPGRYTTAWFEVKEPGTYPILCTEYCGLLHSNMTGSVVALSPQDWTRWLEETQPAAGTSQGPGTAEAPAAGKAVAAPQLVQESTRTGVGAGLATQGREIADRYGCFNCHTTDGRPHIGPTWRGLYGTLVELEDGDRLRADEAYLTESMMDPRQRIVRGYPPIMPSFQGLLDPAQSAALVELIKSLRADETAPAPQIPPWPGSPALQENR